MFGNFLDSATNIVSDFADDPVGKTLEMASQPVADTLDILDGLTEGEIRTKAALRLGTDVVAGMDLDEVISALAESD